MKKKLTLALAALMATATLFTACGKGPDVSGEYTAEMNFSDFIPEEDLASMEEVGMGFMSDLTLDVKLNLTSDNKFTFAFDSTGLKEDVKSGLAANSDAIIDAQLESMGVTRDQITDEVAQSAGYESADAMFQYIADEMASGMDGVLAEADAEFEKGSCEGSYKVVKDSIVFVTETEDGTGLDKATISEDGSLSLTTDVEGEAYTLNFTKAQ